MYEFTQLVRGRLRIQTHIGLDYKAHVLFIIPH